MSSLLLAGMTAFTAGTAGLLVLLLGVPVAAIALYQVALALAAFFYHGFEGRQGGAEPPRTRVTVLVPAHDEAELIARCVRSLRDQTYPSDRYEVVVIADNCTDDTAAIAREAGARVLVREDPTARGKGHALRWALDRVLAQDPPPDAVAVVDADSVAARDFLEALVAPFERGAPAAQGESLLSDEGSPGAALRAAAFLLVNRTRPSGRAVLGLPTTLAGNGMLFGRELLQAHPWDAFSAAEDVEYTIRLRLAGIGPAFAGGAILVSPTAPTAEAATQQQLRWEGGKTHVARTQIPRLVGSALRLRKPLLLEAALELAVPPLGLLTAAAALGTVVVAVLAATGVLPAWSVASWAAALVAIPVYVLVGLRAARAPRSAYRSLARAPLLVLQKLLGAHRLLTFRADSWVRTQRGREDGRTARLKRRYPVARMLRRSLWPAAVGIALAAALAFAGTSARATPARAPKGLHVVGNRLLDTNGRVVRFHGVNRSGTEYSCVQGYGIFDGPSDAASIRAMASWHVNAVRIPLNEDCWLGINGVEPAYSGARYRRAIVSYVRLLHSFGMYAELSLMWAAPGSYRATYQPGAPDRDHAPAVWASMARTFRHDPNVVLAPWGETIVDADCFLRGGICAATYGPANKQYETAGMQQAVTIMRRAGYRGVIAIPGLDFANDLSKWLSHMPSDPRRQLIAEAHVYGKNTCASVACFDATFAPVARRVPLIFGETGETYDASSCAASHIATFLRWADAHRTGYFTWTWNTWGNCSALISDFGSARPFSAYASFVKSRYTLRRGEARLLPARHRGP